MKKLDTSLTNENRKDIIDINYAKCRADKLLVILIFDIYKPENQFDFIFNRYFDDKCNSEIIYRKGEIVTPDKFDENLDKVCSNGIHYFKTIDAAFYYYDQPFNYTGTFIDFSENGQKVGEGNYLNGKRNGKWTYWWYHTKAVVNEYYHFNDQCQQKDFEGEFFNGNKCGHWIYWYHNGKKWKEGNYYEDKQIGTWTYWNIEGVEVSE
jgi:antitoxin component YwqK of YwqJK toxin-antitoxin module